LFNENGQIIVAEQPSAHEIHPGIPFN
jgi:hypothetical protein